MVVKAAKGEASPYAAMKAAEQGGGREGVRERRSAVRRDHLPPPRARPDPHGPRALRPEGDVPDLPRGGLPELHDHLLPEQAGARRRDLRGPGADRGPEAETEGRRDPDRQARGRAGSPDLRDGDPRDREGPRE